MPTSDQPMHAYYKAALDLKDSIEDCLAKCRVLPCLTLLYSGIDVFASLEAQTGESTKNAFLRWVEAYMLKGRSLPCSAIDLYAARCGIIHSFSCSSDLSRSGKARMIMYAWGTADAAKLDRAAQISGRQELSIHIRDLVNAFSQGVINHVDDVADHPERHQRFLEASGHWLTGVSPKLIDQFLELNGPNPSTSQIGNT